MSLGEDVIDKYRCDNFGCTAKQLAEAREHDEIADMLE